MPMSSIGEVGLVAEHAVRTPHDQVGDARLHRAPAPGAHVGFGGLRRGDGLNGPLQAAADLRALPPGDEALERPVVGLR